MNWSELTYIDYKTTAAQYGSKKYYQQYLVPSLYVEVHAHWISKENLLQLHQSLVDSIGHLFNWHHSTNKSRPSGIKEAEKAFGFLPQWLEKPKGIRCWNRFANVDGTGAMNKPEAYGGIGDASLEYFIRKESLDPSNKAQQLQQYKANLGDSGTGMLTVGAPISSIKVCLPISYFESTDQFLQWVLSWNLIQQGAFFSATAGYKINYYQGYSNEEAKKRLLHILEHYPGFDYDMPFGAGTLGRFLNEAQTDFLPVIKRLNWLTFVSEEGLQVVGGLDTLRHKLSESSTLHPLQKGACIQASKAPALAKTDQGFDQYYTVSTALEPLLFKPHERDHLPFSGEDRAVVKKWFYWFHPNNPY